MPASAAPGRPSPDLPAAPRTLDAALVVVLLEALALAGLAVAVAVQAVQGRSASLAVATFMVLFFLGLAAMLVLSARGLRAGRRRGRAPVLAWQLLQGATALTVLQVTGALWVWAALVASVAVVVLVLLPDSVAHTTR